MKNGVQQFGIMALQVIVGIGLMALVFYVLGFIDNGNLKAVGESMGNQIIPICDTCNKTFKVSEVTDWKCPDCGGDLRKLSADRMNVTSGNIDYRSKLPKMKVSEISCSTGETLNVSDLFEPLECEGCDKALTITELTDGKCSVCTEKISLDYAVDCKGDDISDTVKMSGDGVLEGNTEFKADKPGIYEITFIATDVKYDLIVKQKVKISVSEEIESEG